MNQNIPSLLLNNQALNNLQKLRPDLKHGKGAPSLNAYFQHQRKLSDAPGPELQQTWFLGMKNVLEELDQVLRCIPETCPFRFLDVGCCPGGFSSYILGKNLNSTGTGMSLSVESGGHGFLLEEHLQPRLELKLADVTYYQLGLTTINDPRLRPLPFYPGSQMYDLVLLDGHPLRTHTSSAAQKLNGDRLLISQLVICLQAISISGTIIMKLSKPERVITAKLLYMLDVLSLSLGSWKPVFIHATRPTFYVVAKGVGYGRQGYRFHEFLHGLKNLWMQLTYGGAHDTGRELNDQDLDFIVSKTELERTFGNRLQQLGHHVWLVQEESLRGWYQQSGVVAGD